MGQAIAGQMAQRGQFTLPKPMREKYNLRPGDDVTFIDLDGVVVLSPRRSELDALASRVRSTLEAQGETLETMLAALREIRERNG